MAENETNCTTGSQGLYVFYSAVMILEFLVALPLNASVLYIFLFKFKFWKTNTVFLFNLVLADILLLIILPVIAYLFQQGMRRSDNITVCKATLFLLFLNRGASIAFLTVISIDRYLRVVHSRKQTFRKVLKRKTHISIFIWVLLLPLTVPTMLRTSDCCNSHNRDLEFVTGILREIVFFTQILVPFLILLFCALGIIRKLSERTIGKKDKIRRAVFLVSLVVIVFGVCFLPCAVSRMVLLIFRSQGWEDAEDTAVQVYDGIMVLSYIDCLLDPLVYCLSSSDFKTVYMSHFCKCLMHKDRPPPPNTIQGAVENELTPVKKNIRDYAR
ncbi:12-(S)-hydroxy-5,8,10,14-eicosatetraenoic acid receptor [Amia ocellicauda]|uniref:12-(S)-hydroxy-5,8,10,14-eicosatetraenoic acid receptor n=1 Tax=Amia ocellicauda TaxID=2972642 RepID=UPI003463A4B7|nr:GPR31 protein [Amia calva]